jgi:hypothetical protein
MKKGLVYTDWQTYVAYIIKRTEAPGFLLIQQLYPHLQFGSRLASSGGGDQTRWVSNGLVDIEVLVGVVNLELGHIDTKVVLVGKSIVDLTDGFVITQDLLLHLVKSGLD